MADLRDRPKAHARAMNLSSLSSDMGLEMIVKTQNVMFLETVHELPTLTKADLKWQGARTGKASHVVGHRKKVSNPHQQPLI